MWETRYRGETCWRSSLRREVRTSASGMESPPGVWRSCRMQYPDDEEIEAIDQHSDRSCASRRGCGGSVSAGDPRGSPVLSHVKYRKATYVHAVGDAHRDAFWHCFTLLWESSVHVGCNSSRFALGRAVCDGNPLRPIYSKGRVASLHTTAPDVFDAVPFDRVDDALDQVRETGSAPYYVESWYRKLKQEEHRT